MLEKPTESLTVYVGALGFARLVGQLALRTVPLPSLLFWLAKPKGPKALLVESTSPAGGTNSVLAY